MKFRRYRRLTTLMLAAFSLIVWSGSPSAAGSQKDPVQKPPEPIKIHADRLTINGDANWAEFTGKVKVVQGKTTIAAERLRIYYKGKAEAKTDQVSPRGGELEKIEAYGNVRITMDNRVAVTPKAVYSTADQTLTLEGEGSRLQSGRDTIVGKKIVFFRREGRIRVTGSPGKQVEAIIFSEKGVLD